MGPADLELSQAGHELGSILVTLLKDNLLIVSNQNIARSTTDRLLLAGRNSVEVDLTRQICHSQGY